MKTAIVYDRVNKWGGAEQVLLALHELFPKAPLFTSVYNLHTAKWAGVFPKIYTSFLQNIPFAKTNHEYFSALMPLAFESFNFENFDLVISVTSEAAKGIITKPKTKHICYCLTPTRYLWSGYNQYFKGLPFKGVAKPLVNYLRRWDKIAANRPDHVIAISTAVKQRIKKYYGRESEVIFPPVDIHKFKNQKSKIKNQSSKRNSSVKDFSQNDMDEEYFLIVSRLVSYKKVDLAVRAFNKLEKQLVVVGTGREENYLKSIAHRNVIFRGFVDNVELVSLYKNAKAFIHPQDEDFGITAVEAQAAGVPVVAYRSGGGLDTVIDRQTGVFFEEQTADALINVIKNFGKMRFDKEKIKVNSSKYSKSQFKQNFKNYVRQLV